MVEQLVTNMTAPTDHQHLHCLPANAPPGRRRCTDGMLPLEGLCKAGIAMSGRPLGCESEEVVTCLYTHSLSETVRQIDGRAGKPLAHAEQHGVTGKQGKKSHPNSKTR